MNTNTSASGTGTVLAVLSCVLIGAAGFLLLGERLGKRAVKVLLSSEYQTHSEYADAAYERGGTELRFFVLTNYLGYLEDNRDLLLLELQPRDLDFARFLTHGRLFRLYRDASNDLAAATHFVSASNYWYQLRSNVLTEAQLLTNDTFRRIGR